MIGSSIPRSLQRAVCMDAPDGSPEVKSSAASSGKVNCKAFGFGCFCEVSDVSPSSVCRKRLSTDFPSRKYQAFERGGSLCREEGGPTRDLIEVWFCPKENLGFAVGRASLFRLYICRPDYLAPLLGFVADELAEIGWRAGKYRAAECGNLRFDIRIGESFIDRSVQRVHDLDQRALGCAEAEPGAGLIAWQEFAYGRDVRQLLKTRCLSDRQGAELAGFDQLDRRGNVVEHDLHLSAEQVGERGGRAAIWHVSHHDAGSQFE